MQAEQARRLLEQALRNAQRMESQGTLAGGIAHDFNKVLSAILGNTTLAEHEQASDHPVQPRLAHIEPGQPEPPTQVATPPGCEATCSHHRPVRLRWARLLRRVFKIDTAHCPNCGVELKINAAILALPVIEKTLTHLGLQARAPPRAPALRSQLQAA